MLEPEKVIQFRVPWVDDDGTLRVNRGVRVQYNSALGPYHGGIRFSHDVNHSIMKFLAFTQILKNALTGLDLGAARGGTDFDPRGKSEQEILRFCQSFMTELSRHLTSDLDVITPDVGVGEREIDWMLGQYKRLGGQTALLTGKRAPSGGSKLNTQAVGYGCVYFADAALRDHSMELTGKRCLISGSGNVAIHVAYKLLEHGAIPITLSDSSGFMVCFAIKCSVHDKFR